MPITSTDIKTLRELTNAGMMDCKKALVDAKGDIQEAQKLLKERGIVAASKRSGRSTSEGRIACAKNEKAASILELGCETDFVARNEQFVSLAKTLAKTILDNTHTDEMLEKMILEVSSTIKENMRVQRKTTVPIAENEHVSLYLHGEVAGVGSLVKVSVSDAQKKDHSDVAELAHDIALHASAFYPMFVSPDSVPDSYISEQKEIIDAQIKNLGKPEEIAQKIADGKLKKHLQEVCLTEQPFVKNDKVSVAKHIASVAKVIGADIALTNVIVYKVGTE